ncbi:MAG: ATP-binding protein [Cytophagaceae bacterium]|nr:ATP-binding protein [Gemmatimonadaceae bacterium]
MRRIVVTGSESTGKTTLARHLAAALGTIWIPEYARDYASARRGALTVDDVEPIGRGQAAREDAAIALLPPGRDLVLDTDLVSTMIYGDHYYGRAPEWVREQAAKRRGDLYLLCATDVPWEADGVRDQPQARHELHAKFAAQLNALGARVLPVEGTGARRLQSALAAVRGWRAATAC